MKPASFPILLLLGAKLITPSVARAQTPFYIGSPFNAQNITGYQGPFLWDNMQAPSIRYQQVYRNSDFTDFVQGPVMINEISFDTSAAAINVSFANIQVDLSTTSAQPDGLSSTFSANVGHDDAMVYSGPVQLKTTGFGPYEAHIFLQHPFFYDPAMGNLLLDVRNYQTIAPRLLPFLFVAAGDMGDSSSLAIAFDVNSPSAQLGTAALLTRFDGVTVPEPRSLAVLTFGVALWFLVQAVRRRGVR